MKTGRGKLPEDARRQRQLPRAALRRQDHDQPGDRARHLARAGLGRGRQDGRPRAVGAGVLRRQAEDGASRAASINWAVMGDPNASLPTPQPIYYRPMFGAFGQALPHTCVTFVSQAAHDAGIGERLGLAAAGRSPVYDTRKIGKRDMVRNSGTPKIEVDPGDLRRHRRRRACDGAAGRRRSRSTRCTSSAERHDLVITHRKDPRQQSAIRNGRRGWPRRTVDALALDQWEAQKNRFRKKTAERRRGRRLARPRRVPARRRRPALGRRRATARSSRGSACAT